MIAVVPLLALAGTQFSRDANVNFWELQHCGHNECIIRDVEKVEHVAVGDLLFIKGAKFPHGGHAAGGLVHKSPEKRYHPDGRVVNRLVLKVDVMTMDGTGEARVQKALPTTVVARAQRPKRDREE